MTELINIGIAILSGGVIAGIISILTIKSVKKKAHAEADLAEVNVDGAEIDNELKLADGVSKFNDRILIRLEKVEAKCEKLELQVDDLTSKNTAKNKIISKATVCKYIIDKAPTSCPVIAANNEYYTQSGCSECKDK